MAKLNKYSNDINQEFSTNYTSLNTSVNKTSDRTSIDGLDKVFETNNYDQGIVAKQKLDVNEVSLSKEKLVSVLENFVSIMKSETTSNNSSAISVINFDEQSIKLDNMKTLLIDAKQAIIELMQERLAYKETIARLEAQIAVVDELRQQSDIALELAINHSQTKLEITQVKAELEKFRLLRVKAEIDREKNSIWGRIKQWWYS